MYKNVPSVGVATLLLPLFLEAGPLGFQIGTQFSGLSFNQGAGWFPPDMGLGVGANEIVQMVNGGYEIFNRSGVSLTGAQSDIRLWTGAGVSASLVSGGSSLTDPRVVFDPVSGQYIASQVNFTSGASSNVALIGISKTSDPFTGGWNAVTFTAKPDSPADLRTSQPSALRRTLSFCGYEQLRKQQQWGEHIAVLDSEIRPALGNSHPGEQ
jgi:hypothetical protein